MNIIFRPIPLSQPETLLLHKKTAKNTALLVFYMNNIFRAFNTNQEQYIFLRNYLFQSIVWSKLKRLFSKLKIRINKIFALGKEHKIGGKIRLKLDKIGKILLWLVPQDQILVKAFLRTI